MASVHKKQRNIETVGALIAALKKYPAFLPIEVGSDDHATVYMTKPTQGECGVPTVNIEGEDPWGED